MQLITALAHAVLLAGACFTAALAGPAPDGIELTLSGPTIQLTLDWNGGQPDFQVFRASDPAAASGVENLRGLTSGFTFTETAGRPQSGEAFYYLVAETGLAAGAYPATWINGESCATEPAIQVHAYNPNLFILRQSLCTSFEGPFIYLIFGQDKVLMQDTGDGGIPIASTVYGIIDQWLFDNGQASIDLVVSHSHGHGDHVAGDGQFQGQPNTTVVGLSQTAVAGFFGVASWPDDIVEYDLGGGRIVDVIPIPGHQSAHVALYDRQTGLLLTGDTLYPGRCYIGNFSQYQASVQRLVDFIADKPVVRVLGTHIEMTNTPYDDFPFGATVHPDEHPLELRREHLIELRDGVDAMAGSPFIDAHREFIIWPL